MKHTLLNSFTNTPNPYTARTPRVRKMIARTVLTIRHYWKFYKLGFQIWAERQRLKELPEERLKDMGIDSNNVIEESQRSFYDVPQDRL